METRQRKQITILQINTFFLVDKFAISIPPYNRIHNFMYLPIIVANYALAVKSFFEISLQYYNARASNA